MSAMFTRAKCLQWPDAWRRLLQYNDPRRSPRSTLADVAKLHGSVRIRLITNADSLGPGKDGQGWLCHFRGFGMALDNP